MLNPGSKSSFVESGKTIGTTLNDFDDRFVSRDSRGEGLTTADERPPVVTDEALLLLYAEYTLSVSCFSRL